MATYKKASYEERALLDHAFEKYHDRLKVYGVTVDLIVAFAPRTEEGKIRGVAIMAGGYPALAQVKITPLKQRVQGIADATITLDGDRWGDHEREQQIAILDHELCHLETIEDEEAVALVEAIKSDDEKSPPPDRTKEAPRPIKLDDIGRPKLRIRKHDHQFGWFDDVVRRHGRSSIEWSQFDAFKSNALKQTWLPGLGPDDAIDQDVAAAASDPNSHGVDPEPEEAIEDFAKRMEASGLRETKRDIRLHRSAVDREQLAELQNKSKKALDRMGVVAKAPGVTKTRRRKAAATG
jgi:hypothetical protein